MINIVYSLPNEPRAGIRDADRLNSGIILADHARAIRAEMEEQPYSEEDGEWDAFVAATSQRQPAADMTNWARLKNRFGWHSQRVWLRRDGQLGGRRSDC